MNDRKRQQRRAADMMIRSKSRGRFTFDDLSDALARVSEALASVGTTLVDFAHTVSHAMNPFKVDLARVQVVENDQHDPT